MSNNPTRDDALTALSTLRGYVEADLRDERDYYAAMVAAQMD